MKYTSIFAIASLISVHNNLMSMQYQDCSAGNQAGLLTHSANRVLVPKIATSNDVAQLSNKIDAFRLATTYGFDRMDSKVSLAQRACDVLAMVQQSRDVADHNTHILLGALAEQLKISQSEKEAQEKKIELITNQIEQQHEKQQLMLDVLTQLTQKKTTHEMATQTEEYLPQSASASSAINPTTQTVGQVKPLCINPDKNFMAWKKKQQQKKINQGNNQ